MRSAHPNIVPVYELGVELGTYFLAMEYVEGVEPRRAAPRCTAGKPLSPEEGAYVGVEVCRALDYAHRRMSVVHRDVTPRNVMVDEEGQVKVIDFGISRRVATAPMGQGVFGSPGHMPPEQMAGASSRPRRTCSRSAVLLMELWSGTAPFRRHTIEATSRRRCAAPHPKPSDADIRLLPLDEVMASAMSLDPEGAPAAGRGPRARAAQVPLGRRPGRRRAAARRAREAPCARALRRATGEKKPKLQRPPSRPSAQDIGTRTFAAREEVLPTAGRGARRLDAQAAAAQPATIAADAREGPAEGDRDGRHAAHRERAAGREDGAGQGKKRGAGVVWVAMAGAIALAVGAFYAGKGTGLTGTDRRRDDDGDFDGDSDRNRDCDHDRDRRRDPDCERDWQSERGSDPDAESDAVAVRIPTPGPNATAAGTATASGSAAAAARRSRCSATAPWSASTACRAARPRSRPRSTRARTRCCSPSPRRASPRA